MNEGVSPQLGLSMILLKVFLLALSEYLALILLFP
uniref:Uncharacterized protein n=1 Tax=Rhizophora mucronata TaxID=61149 RepID=A0A2P2K1A1_RHIMU